MAALNHFVFVILVGHVEQATLRDGHCSEKGLSGLSFFSHYFICLSLCKRLPRKGLSWDAVGEVHYLLFCILFGAIGSHEI